MRNLLGWASSLGAPFNGSPPGLSGKLLAGTDEFGLDPTMLRGLRKRDRPGLRATKTMAQAIGRSIVLWCSSATYG